MTTSSSTYRKGHASNVERLLDLAEIARFTLEGQKVNQVFFAERIHPMSATSASTVLRRLSEFAKLIGHEVRSEPDPDGTSWLVVPADPERLLWDATRELGLTDPAVNAGKRETARRRRHREYLRERRSRCRAAGICVYCKVPVSGMNACVECRRKQADWASTRYEDRKARGDCWRCEEPVDEAVYCQPCAAIVAEAAAKRRREAAARGLCSRCAVRDAEGGKSYCRECLDQARSYRVKNPGKVRESKKKTVEGRRSKGLCVLCGEASARDGLDSCGPCSAARNEQQRAWFATRPEQVKKKVEKAANRKARLLAQGLCPTCGKEPVLGEKKLGPTCYLRKLETQRASAARRYARNKAEGLCATCSQPAMPGKMRCAPCNDKSNASANEYYRSGRRGA